MIFLISGILAIALFATMMVIGSGSLNTDAIVRRETAHVVQSSVANIGNAFQAYRIANNGARPSEAGWRAEMADYAPSRSADQMARPAKGMVWTYRAGPGRSWFCLSGDSPSAAIVQGLASVARESGFGKATIAVSCPEDGTMRASGESNCTEANDLCAGLLIDGSSARALVLYPQG